MVGLMVGDVVLPCWKGDIDITPLSKLFDEVELKSEIGILEGILPTSECG